MLGDLGRGELKQNPPGPSGSLSSHRCAARASSARTSKSFIPCFSRSYELRRNFVPRFSSLVTFAALGYASLPYSLKRQSLRYRGGLAGFVSSGRQDSNLRPLAPHASALPGCATSRNENFVGCKGKEKNGLICLTPFNFFLANLFQIIGLILAFTIPTSNLSYSKKF